MGLLKSLWGNCLTLIEPPYEEDQPMMIIRTLPILSFCISCASTSKETPETRTVDPTTVGEYYAVSRTVNVPSRDELILPTQLWYPSQQPSLDLHRYGELKEGGAFASGAVDCSTTRPVVLFSHGNTGMGYQSYFWANS